MNMNVMINEFLQARRILWKKLSRRLLHLRMIRSDEAERLRAERVLRGKEQNNTLQKADFVVVSFGKSGRTWLRVMMSQALRLHWNIPGHAMLGFDNFHNMNRQAPKIFFTHDNYIKDYAGQPDSKSPFYGKKVILLARDPRDTSVSNYFQWKFRMKPNKKKINNYPAENSDIGVFDYMTSQHGGSLADVIGFLNIWAKEADKITDFHLVRYEDLRRDTATALRELLDFMAIPVSDKHLAAAVEFSSYENMKKMEERNASSPSGRLAPKDKDNPNSYKVRRAKVGGYRDYLEDDQVEQVDKLVASTLDPMYQYTGPTSKQD